MVLTKCVRPEGNIRSDSFHLQLNFEFVQDMEESRRVSKRRSLTAAMHAASSNLLDPKERCVHIHLTFMNLAYRTAEFDCQCYPVTHLCVPVFCVTLQCFFYSILSTRWPPNIYRKDNHVLAIMVSRGIPTCMYTYILHIHSMYVQSLPLSHFDSVLTHTMAHMHVYLYGGACTLGLICTICICGLQAEHKCEGLLQHPLVVTMLNEKWFQFGAQLYVWNLLLYILQVLFLTAFSLSLPHPLSPSCESPHIHNTYV